LVVIPQASYHDWDFSLFSQYLQASPGRVP
jgi:hypothetical protein